MSENRTVVAGLPWSRGDHATREVWGLDIDGIMVWVKDYGAGVSDSDSFRGWRIGRGGSPLVSLNDGEPYESREAAMLAAKRVAQVTARDHLRDAEERLSKAIKAMEEVVLTP